MDIVKKVIMKLDMAVSRLNALPIGCLVKHKVRGRIYYGHQYVSAGRRVERYIPLAQAAYWEKLFKRRDEVQAFIMKCRTYLKPYKRQLPRLREELRLELLAREKVKSFPHPENYKHRTLRGEYVASKSEVLIADYLYLHKIRYEYSEKIKVGRITLHPDFTLYLGHRRIFWEHLGMLHKKSYARDWEFKKAQYARAGIKEGVNLICTQDHNEAIDMQEIDKLVRSWGILKRRKPSGNKW